MISKKQKKEKAYQLFWDFSDSEMEKMFPLLDGFWSTSTKSIGRTLDRSGKRGMFMNANWAWTGQLWRCPVCKRSKPDIAKVGKSGKMIFVLVEHHDHASNLFMFSEPTIQGVKVQRFPATLVCLDCNVAEANVKSALKLEESFSFTPSEISRFIKPTSNHSHSVDFKTAKEIYDAQIGDVRRRIMEVQREPIERVPGCQNHQISDAQMAPFIRLAEKTGLHVGLMTWGFNCRSRTHQANEEYRMLQIDRTLAA